MSSGSAAIGGLFIFTLNGSPILFWIAVVSVVLGVIFLVHLVIKRRKEARDAQLIRPSRQMI